MLEKTEKRDYSKIKRLYNEAFPKEERKPFYMVRLLRHKKVMECYTIEEDGVAGLMMTTTSGKITLLNYFAVMPDRRGGGIGSKALKELIAQSSGQLLFLEIEEVLPSAPNYDERLHRKNFYLRNGLSESNLYSEMFGVKMEVLTSGGSLTPEEYMDFYRKTFSDRMASHIKAYYGSEQL